MAGGSTFSCSPLSMIVGRRIGEYLRPYKEQVYPKINQLGARLRTDMAAAFQKRGIPVQTTGLGSLGRLCFPFELNAPTIRNPSQMQELTDMKRVDHEFRLRMINHGVFISFSGGTVSFAHTDDDIDRIIAATEQVAHEMA